MDPYVVIQVDADIVFEGHLSTPPHIGETIQHRCIGRRVESVDWTFGSKTGTPVVQVRAYSETDGGAYRP